MAERADPGEAAPGTDSTPPSRRGRLALSPRGYLLVDRGSKVVGLLVVGLGLAHAFGPASPIAIVGGIAVGVASVFVDVRDEPGDDG